MQLEILSLFFLSESKLRWFILSFLFLSNLKGVKVLKLPLLVGLVFLRAKRDDPVPLWSTTSSVFSYKPSVNPFPLTNREKEEFENLAFFCGVNVLRDGNQNQLTWLSYFNLLESWTINLLITIQLVFLVTLIWSSILSYLLIHFQH